MQQIKDWLEKLGMSEYARRFGENRVDPSVLSEITGFASTTGEVARSSQAAPLPDH